jgi:hypothetical protein
MSTRTLSCRSRLRVVDRVALGSQRRFRTLPAVALLSSGRREWGGLAIAIPVFVVEVLELRRTFLRRSNFQFVDENREITGQ